MLMKLIMSLICDFSIPILATSARISGVTVSAASDYFL